MAIRIIEKCYLVKNFGNAIVRFYLVSFLSANPAFARLTDTQTTRLKSTAGAGVAALLMDESTILNPAPLAFFTESSFYFQKSDGSQTPETPANSPKTEFGSKSFIVSDSKGALKGSISYIDQSVTAESRETIGFALASNVGKESSMGLSYRHIKEKSFLSDYSTTLSARKYEPVSVGVLHALSPNFTVGMVLIDPFKKVPNENKAIIGVQYLYQDFVAVMLDAGADYNDGLSDKNLIRAALQIRIFSDFFLRAGTFNDRITKEKGTGVGIGWISPKLYADVALKDSTILNDQPLLQKGQELKEFSFSVALHF